MKPKTLLVLLAVVLVLGAFIAFYEKDLPSTDEREELAGKVLGLEADDVEALVLGAGDDAVRLERVAAETPDREADDADDSLAGLGGTTLDDGAWRLTAPLQARADAIAVSDLVDRLVGVGKERDLEDVERDALGLDAPRAEVTVETSRGPVVLRVGTELPLSGSVAVEVERGGAATLIEATRVGDDLLDLLAQDASAWRDPRLVPAQRGEIERLVLTAPAAGDDPARRLVLARRGSGETFWLEEPFADRAAAEAVGPLLTGLAGLQATTFLDASTDVPGLAAPTAVLDATVAGSDQPIRLEVAGAAGDDDAGETSEEGAAPEGAAPERAAPGPRIVRVVSSDTADADAGGQIATADVGFLLDALERPDDAWRSRDLTSVQVFEIDAAAFEGPAVQRAAGVDRLEIERVDAVWQRLVDGEGVELDYSVASAALYPLADAVAEDLIDASTVRLAAPQLTVELRVGDEVERITLHGDGAGASALVEGRPVVLTLSAETTDAIFAALAPLAVTADETAEDAAADDAGDADTDDAGTEDITLEDDA